MESIRSTFVTDSYNKDPISKDSSINFYFEDNLRAKLSPSGENCDCCGALDPGCGECFSRVLQSTTLRGRNHQLDQLQLGTRANYLHKLRSTVTFNQLSGIMVDWTFRGLYKDNGVESDI